jgi:hypothetical protein
METVNGWAGAKEKKKMTAVNKLKLLREVQIFFKQLHARQARNFVSASITQTII